MGLIARKPGFGNNKCVDNPAHLRSLISTFVIRFLEKFISRLATSENSIFLLVPVAEQAGLNITLSETPRQVFSRRGPYDVGYCTSKLCCRQQLILTFPEVLIPLARQMMTRTQARSRQSASSHFMEPISCTPLVISNTTLLQRNSSSH